MEAPGWAPHGREPLPRRFPPLAASVREHVPKPAAFGRALGEPLEPLEQQRVVLPGAKLLDPRLNLFPQQYAHAADDLFHEIERDAAAKNQESDRLEARAERERGAFVLRLPSSCG